jgi:GAF domain-containing protein
VTSFHAQYLACFRRYLREPGEVTLGAAYDLGREAVTRDLSVMDVAIAHHDALAATLGRADAAGAAERIARAAGDFFLESLAAFDMVQRGFREARDAAELERRHAEMLRQLSHFLADASLALDGPDALSEVLRLVAEHARELVRADGCLVTLGAEPQARVRAASYPEDDPGWTAFVRWAELTAIEAIVRSAPGESVRLDAAALGRQLPRPGSAFSEGPLANEWLGVALTALSGRVLGCLHLVATRRGAFGSVDEAVAVHLAQMAAAAVERAAVHATTT